MIRSTVRNRVAFLTLDRPERANALDLAGWYALRDALRAAGADDDVHCIVLHATGAHFCSGMDLSVFGELTARFSDTADPDARRTAIAEFIRELQDCITAAEDCGKPVLAAVQGGCIGGGLDLVAACDARYCSEDAYFTIKEVDLGIVADLGTLQRLPDILRPGLVAELAYTGRRMAAPEALTRGLVNASYPDPETLLAAVNALAETIAAKPPAVVRGIKHTLLHRRGRGVGEGLRFVADLSAALIGRAAE